MQTFRQHVLRVQVHMSPKGMVRLFPDQQDLHLGLALSMNVGTGEDQASQDKPHDVRYVCLQSFMPPDSCRFQERDTPQCRLQNARNSVRLAMTDLHTREHE
jgi:hypothetical protein